MSTGTTSYWVKYDNGVDSSVAQVTITAVDAGVVATIDAMTATDSSSYTNNDTVNAAAVTGTLTWTGADAASQPTTFDGNDLQAGESLTFSATENGEYAASLTLSTGTTSYVPKE